MLCQGFFSLTDLLCIRYDFSSVFLWDFRVQKYVSLNLFVFLVLVLFSFFVLFLLFVSFALFHFILFYIILLLFKCLLCNEGEK